MADMLTRRSFLKATAMTAAGAALIACQPQTVVVKETVVVQGTPVEVTKVVEKEKVVTATPEPPSQYKEAPEPAALVQQGKLSPVDERIPAVPLIIAPHEEIGEYGGTWHRLALSPGDTQHGAKVAGEHLFRYPPDGSALIANLANWEASSDGKAYTLVFHKGMKWSDGEPYTADDILFYYEDVLLNEELTPTFPDWLVVGGEKAVVEKVDDFTLQFKFVGPYALFPACAGGIPGDAFTCYSKHYLMQYHAKYAEKAKLDQLVKDRGFEFWYQLFSNRATRDGTIEQPVYLAWKITVEPPAQPIVAQRNPYYWKVDTEGNQLPYLDRIEWMLVPQMDQLTLRAITGEVDMQLRHVTFTMYPLMQENKEKGDYRVFQWQQGGGPVSLWPNLTHKDPVLREIINDKRFRYALSLGMNRQEIIDGLWFGVSQPSQIQPLPSSPYYWEEYAKTMVEHDPARANAYLDEMGLTQKDAEGYRLRPDGKRLKIVYEYAPLFEAFAPVGELLQAQWRELGIEVIILEEARELYYERKAASEHDLNVSSADLFNPLLDPRAFVPFSNESSHAIQYYYWWSSGGKEGEEPTGDIRKVLELWDELKVSPDEDTMAKKWRQILEINKDNLWVLGISTALPMPVIVKNDFRNVPEKAAYDSQMRTPAGNTWPEQYFWRKG